MPVAPKQSRFVPALAALAHDLWRHSLKARGWRAAPKGRTKLKATRHDALRPFRALSQEDQEYLCTAIAGSDLLEMLRDPIGAWEMNAGGRCAAEAPPFRT